MKKYALAAATFLCILAAAPAHAQVGFGLAGGLTGPHGDLADFVDPGFHGGAVLEVGIPLFPISFRADAMLQQLPAKAGGEDFRQISGTLNGRLALLPLPFASVYLTGGVGLYSSDYAGDRTFTTAQSTVNGTQRDVGFNVGVGGRLNLLVVRPFVEARYHRLSNHASRAFIPVTVGIVF